MLKVIMTILVTLLTTFTYAQSSKICDTGSATGRRADVNVLGEIKSQAGIILFEIEAITSSTPRALDERGTCTRIGIIKGLISASSFGYGHVKYGSSVEAIASAETLYKTQFESYCGSSPSESSLRYLVKNLNNVRDASDVLLNICSSELHK